MSNTPQIKIVHDIGNIITIPNELNIKCSTYLSSNIAAGVVALPVENTTDFSSGEPIVLLVSSLGAENAEVITTSTHTDQSFDSSTTVMAHNRGDIVSQLNYDQLSVTKSSTIDGVYAALSTRTMSVTQQSTVFLDKTGVSTDYYKIQWKNSGSGLTSTATTAISVDAYPVNSVASIINSVLKAMGISENDPKINMPFCLSSVNDARKFTHAKLYGIRQAWQQEFEYPLRLLAGTNYVDLPSDIDFNETDQSILAAKFTLNNILTPFNLRPIDKRTWNQVSFSVTGGTTSAAALSGAVSITLDSVGDFPDSTSGVAYVATTAYSQTIDEIAYTSIDLTTNQLLGVTGLSRNIPSGTRVWSNPTVSQPIYYTVFDDKLYFDRVIPDSMQGQNLYIDYYKKIDEVESLSQELPEHYREIYKFYLRYAIKYRKDISLGSDDPDLKKFESLVQALFNNIYTGQTTTIVTD